MTTEQHKHLESLEEKFSELLYSKYTKGQAEHGGNLWDRDCLEDAIPEVVDLATYLLTEQQKKIEVISLVESVIGQLVDDNLEYPKAVLGQALKLLKGK